MLTLVLIYSSHMKTRQLWYMQPTVQYYNQHADQFIAATLHLDMEPLYRCFLRHLPAGAHLLDAGCGSGRDALAFKQRGYRVSAFDASQALAEHAAKLLGQPVPIQRFDELDAHESYDGIWACASLLHIPPAEMPTSLQVLWRSLKPGGVFYCSFKYGTGEQYREGRHFTNADEERIRFWTQHLADLTRLDCWLSEDQRPEREEQWLNCLLHKATHKLITGGDSNPFLPHLCRAIHRADTIDMAVAFIKQTGLRLLLPDLQAALERATTRRQRTNIRILTSDYLGITDPQALRTLMLLQEQGAQVRVYQTAGGSFHLKAYVFAGGAGTENHWGCAFIGSSNISRQALQQGLEWNYRINYPGDKGFLEANAHFQSLFNDPATTTLSDSWIDDYEARRNPPEQTWEPGSSEVDPPPTPTFVQTQALEALRQTRLDGFRRGLVVMATGLGKTWLAAFDTQQAKAHRILFVAHREEILNQAAGTFARIRPSARIGFYHGRQRDTQVDILCASIQTLGRIEHLDGFDPKHFDYIIVDEFHHAAAPTYHRLLQHFAPTFMLGLTATPDRSDNASILAFCDDNLVFQSDMFSGVHAGLLVPFHYYGIFDESVDYQSIPWRNGRFDPDLLGNRLATLARARHALKTWRERAQQCTLAFCVSIRHAVYMAEHFTRHGVRAAAVYADAPLSRGEALEQLATGQLQVLFSVDLFNEGVDLPAIDTVMLLRPTESRILFLQQLGRGLRKAPAKERLVVLDFVANHKSFLHKPMALMNQTMTHLQLANFARNLKDQTLDLPEGCFINYDLRFIDFLKSLGGTELPDQYHTLRATLGRRPTLTEFYHYGASLQAIRKHYGHWFGFIADLETELELVIEERAVIKRQADLLRHLETAAMNKSYKMVLLEAFQELDGWREAPTLVDLAERSWQVLQRRRPLLADVPSEWQQLVESPDGWGAYWKKNPVAAWLGSPFFSVEEGRFIGASRLSAADIPWLTALVQELVDYRLATYEVKIEDKFEDKKEPRSAEIINLPTRRTEPVVPLPYFPDLKIACGYFKTGTVEHEEYRDLSSKQHGRLDPARHFIARASGNSMSGGKQPVQDGDYLLLEHISADNAGSITGDILAIERQDTAGHNQYLLRKVLKDSAGQYRLRATHPDYADIVVTPELQAQFRTFARLKAVLESV